MRYMTIFKRVYNYYSSLGYEDSPDNTFVMNRMQFWRFLKDCRFHHHDITLTEMDRALGELNVIQISFFKLNLFISIVFIKNFETLKIHVLQVILLLKSNNLAVKLIHWKYDRLSNAYIYQWNILVFTKMIKLWQHSYTCISIVSYGYESELKSSYSKKRFIFWKVNKKLLDNWWNDFNECFIFSF